MLTLATLFPWSAPRPRPSTGRRTSRPALRLEQLEARTLLSAAPLTVAPLKILAGHDTPLNNGLTPAQVRHAYGFDQAKVPGKTTLLDGTGQTIAVVIPYSDPTVTADVAVFNKAFGLPALPLNSSTPSTPAKTPPAGPTLTIVNQTGGSALPAADASWAYETALDVEWAHAIAPGANILLVEANSSSFLDLIPAVDYARNQTGVVAVSMSWGALEFQGENQVDGLFTTPAGHLGGSSGQQGAANLPGGVTFVTAAGDWGGALLYPAVSPNVLTVGGTQFNSDGSEIGWGSSGGGYSRYESKPSFQTAQSSGSRTSPDVAYDASPTTGFAVYSSTPDPSGVAGWYPIGGTSAGAPQWAALLALADQARAQGGKGSLGNAQALLYKLPTADFHDITKGSNGYPAVAGYDLNTGLGTPAANLLIPALLTADNPTTSQGKAVNSNAGSTKQFVPLGTVASPQLASPAAAPAARAVPHNLDPVFENGTFLNRPLTDEVMEAMRSRPTQSLTAGVGGTSDPDRPSFVELETQEQMWWLSPDAEA